MVELAKRRVYEMLVETASLSGAILLILGTASGMAWAVAQSGVIQEMTNVLTKYARRNYRLHNCHDHHILWF
jgi:TRAP-type C4-dicarboxylate transport system permease large subunit